MGAGKTSGAVQHVLEDNFLLFVGGGIPRTGTVDEHHRVDPAIEIVGLKLDMEAGADIAVASALAASEVADAVRRALAGLPEQYRTIVVLRHYENLKFREIAEVLDLPEGTVKTRMTEALNELARRLRVPLDLRVVPPPGRRSRPRENVVL